MTFRLTIETDNAAFEGLNCQLELALILRELADKIERNIHLDAGVLRDSNGNRVGDFTGAAHEEDQEVTAG